MNPLDARESEEAYEYPARPYTLPMRPVQTFRVLSESGDVPAAQVTEIDDEWSQVKAALASAPSTDFYLPVDDARLWGWVPWSDKYLTAEDARVLRQDGI